MERSNFTTLGSVITTVLFAGALLLSGCSDSLTGVSPESDNVTVQQQAQHNQVANQDTDGGSTDPRAGHNTSDED